MAPTQPQAPQPPLTLQPPQGASNAQNLAQMLRGGLQLITLGLEADARALLAARDTLCKAPVYPGDDTCDAVEEIRQRAYVIMCTALCIYAGADVVAEGEVSADVVSAAAAEWAAMGNAETPLPPPHAPVAEAAPPGLVASLIAAVSAATVSALAVADAVERLTLTADGEPNFAALRAALAGHAEGVAPALAAAAAARRAEMLAEILEDLISELADASAPDASAPDAGAPVASA